MMSKRKNPNNPDQLDIFEDRLLKSVENNKDAQRTPKEELLKKILILLSDIGFGPDFVQEDFEKKHYVSDCNVSSHKIEARLYMLQVVKECIKSNSFVCVATGLGKTYIELLIALYFLKYRSCIKKILILAPTKPLCEQHKHKAEEVFVGISIAVLTGNVSQNKRKGIWDSNQIIIATPQTIFREIKKNSGIGNSKDIQLVIFDEVHNMTGHYDYVNLANIYSEHEEIRLLGFTASIDSDHRKLDELLQYLKLKYSNVIVKTENSPDVAPYTYKKNIRAVKITRQADALREYLRGIVNKEFLVTLESMKSKLRYLESEKYSPMTSLEKSLYINGDGLIVGINIKKFDELIKMLSQIREIEHDKSICSLAMRDWGLLVLFHTAINMLDKGLYEFSAFLERKYFEKINKKPSQTSFKENKVIKESIKKLCEAHLWNSKMEHPLKYDPMITPYNWYPIYKDAKLKKLEDVIRMNMSSQILIFVHYRDTLDKVIKYLRTVFPEKKIDQFIGQSNKLNGRGMTQKKQAEILNQYTNGEIDILVATSIGEQGLNFPSVDAVFFYEPITDPRRVIQRIGRTGRYRDGDIFILAYCGKNEKEELISNICFAKLGRAKGLTEFYEEHGDHF